MRFDTWNNLPDPANFLQDDRANPARRAALTIMLDAASRLGMVPNVLEVGPGPGWDYRDHFQQHVQLGLLRYRAIEGSAAFIDVLRSQWPDLDVRHGTFDDLQQDECDFAYCKAVLEHQPYFYDPLRKLVQAARHMLVLTWYLPPTDYASLRQAPDGCWYNTYQRQDVLSALDELGCTPPDILEIPSFHNEIWTIRRR